MKKNPFIIFVIIVLFILICLQIHKHTLFIKISYNQQECEKKIAALIAKKQILSQELCALKDRDNIKKYAQTQLQMKPYALKQVTKLHRS